MSTEDLIGAGAIAGSLGLGAAGINYLDDIDSLNRKAIHSDISNKYKKMYDKADKVFDDRSARSSRKLSLASPYRYELEQGFKKANPYTGNTNDDMSKYLKDIDDMINNDKVYKKMTHGTSSMGNAILHDKVNKAIGVAKSKETKKMIGKLALKDMLKSNAVRTLALGGTVYGASKIIGSERDEDMPAGVQSLLGSAGVGVGGNIGANTISDLFAKKQIIKSNEKFDKMEKKINSLEDLNKDYVTKATDRAHEYKDNLRKKITKGRKLTGKPDNISLDFDMARDSNMYKKMLNENSASKRDKALKKAGDIIQNKRFEASDNIGRTIGRKAKYAKAIINALALSSAAYGISKMKSDS